MSDIPKFAIFYHDDSIVEGGGEDDELVEITFKVSKKWLDAPIDGVQAVVVENPYSCRYVWRGQDYYFVIPQEHEIHASDNITPFHNIHLKGIVKQGLCLGQEQYVKVMEKVKEYKKISTECERKTRPDFDLD